MQYKKIILATAAVILSVASVQASNKVPSEGEFCRIQIKELTSTLIDGPMWDLEPMSLALAKGAVFAGGDACAAINNENDCMKIKKYFSENPEKLSIAKQNIAHLEALKAAGIEYKCEEEIKEHSKRTKRLRDYFATLFKVKGFPKDVEKSRMVK